MDVQIGPAPARAIVILKLPIENADIAAKRLSLPPALHARGADPRSLWLGPGHWLIVSASQPATAIVQMCDERLVGILHLAVDCSDAFSTLTLRGSAARTLLSFDSGFDFRARSFEPGRCCRTRLAKIAAVVVSLAEDELEVLVERSLAGYLRDWLSRSIASVTATPRDIASPSPVAKSGKMSS